MLKVYYRERKSWVVRSYLCYEKDYEKICMMINITHKKYMYCTKIEKKIRRKNKKSLGQKPKN